MNTALTDSEFLRYSRHLLLEEVGEAGQLKLKQASVLVVGVGGLGSPVALYLAAAGVGRLLLADHDQLDVTNLQRQILFASQQVKQPKVRAAQQRLRSLNPETEVVPIPHKLDAESLPGWVAQADLVLDCSDNMLTRQAVNAACFQQGMPLIVGAGIRFEGQLMAFDPRRDDSPCYHCLFPGAQEAQLNCRNAGVIGPVVGTIGSLQALEAIKLLIGMESTLIGQLKLFDGKTLDWKTFSIRKEPGCPVCGH